MKYTFHIVGVFRSAPLGGNQLAVRPARPASRPRACRRYRAAAQGISAVREASLIARAGTGRLRARCAEPLGRFDPKAPLNSPLARGIGAGLFTRPWVRYKRRGGQV